jgi:A/G-specific adenine glycosylase
VLQQCTAGRAASSIDLEDIAKGTTCKMCLPLDPPSLDREVTLYPLKVVKKKSRDEDIAVCVVEWFSSSTDVEQGSMVLLVKRPKTGMDPMTDQDRCMLTTSPGLLAGLDEFPSAVMPDSESSPTDRLAQSLELLNELLVLPKSFVLKPLREYTALSVTGTTDLGSIKHIYSHINATFHCRHLKLSSEKPPRIQAEKGRCRWVEKSAIASANISTGAVKIWDLVNGKEVKGKTKKKLAKEETVKIDIKQFLTRKPASSQENAIESSAEQPEETPRKKRKLVIIESDSE